MAKQLHKRFSTQEVKMLLQKYLDEKVKLIYILETLGVKRSRFFELVKEYKKDPDSFSIQYRRKRSTRKISEEIEKNIINELQKEKKLIEDKNIPITSYNYSYIKELQGIVSLKYRIINNPDYSDMCPNSKLPFLS